MGGQHIGLITSFWLRTAVVKCNIRKIKRKMVMADVQSFSETDNQSHARVRRDLERSLSSEAWSIQLKVALACRKLAADGHALTLAGQVTVRHDADTYWTSSIRGGFANAVQSSVVRFNDTMETVEGDGIPNPGVQFHLWIYRKRPEIRSIVHTHSPYASALSMTGQPLEAAHMDSAMFYDDCAYLAEWPGVPIADDEGRIICEALGGKRSILLSNHGFLTTGKSLEEATYLAVLFENAARLQLLAQSVGNIQAIEKDAAKEAHDFLLQTPIVNGTFNSWAYELLRNNPEITS